MLSGSRLPGATPVNLPGDTVILNASVELEQPQYLVRVGAYLDGQGPSDADQIIRGVLYTAAGALLAAGAPVTVPVDEEAGWVWLTFPGLDGLALPAGGYRFGLHSGVTSNGARIYTGGSGSRTAFSGHVFTDGAPASVAGGTTTGTPASFLLETIDAVRVPSSAEVDDDYLATLPFDVTQRVFGAAGKLRHTHATAVAGWYGTSFDPTSGASAIVRTDGMLAQLVGERILVTRRKGADVRTVAVYVHDEREFPDELADEDLLLTKRAFLALADPALDALDVTVDVLA